MRAPPESASLHGKASNFFGTEAINQSTSVVFALQAYFPRHLTPNSRFFAADFQPSSPEDVTDQAQPRDQRRRLIGVARILSGGALFRSKKLTTFFSRHHHRKTV